MLNGKPVLGVCITKIDDTSRAEYMHKLHHLAHENGYKIIVFNSFIDFFNRNAFDKGAKSVFDIINNNIIDALAIHTDSFCDSTVVDEIINNAKKKSIPVILLGREEENCFSIVGDYENAFKEIIRHVICDHGATDTYFIAGVKPADIFSQRRIKCYKEVLEENGLPFSDDMVGFGGYWDGPTIEIVKELLKDGKKPPRAIICANDYMAFAACNELKNNGYRVPEDVIVTGYDGVPASEHFNPRITTCKEDLSLLAEKTLEAFAMALEKKEPCTINNPFTSVISESCGCTIIENMDFRNTATELYNVIDHIKIHEEYMFSCINNMLDIKDLNDLYTSLSECILDNSYVCFNNDFVTSVIENNHSMRSKFSDELILIPAKYSSTKVKNLSRMNLSDIVPNIEGWNDDPTTYIISSIYVGNEVYGYYAFKTDNIIGASYKIKRVLNAINIALTSATSYFKQLSMRLSIKRSSVINTLSDLPNLKGTATWYEEFATPDNQQKAITVSVYALPKYTYILENYGIEAVEAAIVIVSNALKLANQKNCFIGHISHNEFVVINYYDNPKDIGDTITAATSVFFEEIENYNSSSGKEYYIEVNCGCTVVNPDWSGSIESFIKFANIEMYMNRLKFGTGSVVKEETSTKDFYKPFQLLIEKNLFMYHFQPIVNAKNGEIYAYEALMRTDENIGMTPKNILDTAKEYGRLYDIEKATMFNVMERFANEIEKFGDKKLFINTIPGHFLNESDIDILLGKYGKYMERFIFELTEQDSVSDSELEKLRRLSTEEINSNVAIDDYGTGHSNIVNLMRYSPQIIKIDRYLIDNIHKNQNKQHFVRSTIEFAKLNGIMVLAEGVETSNELHTLIDLGVDLVQGYYTGRPAPEPIPHIADEIRTEIQQANPLF